MPIDCFNVTTPEMPAELEAAFDRQLAQTMAHYEERVPRGWDCIEAGLEVVQ